MARKTNKTNCFRRNILISIFFIFYTSNLIGQTNQLILFTGSDWCLNCMHLEKTILNSEEFAQFASQNFSIMQVDFPQKKKQTKEEMERNEALAEKYNKSGVFPLLLLIKDGKTISIPFHRQESGEFIDELKNILSTHE